MDTLTVRQIIKDIALMGDEEFQNNIEKSISDFIKCITYLNALPYNDFRYIYNELFEIVSSGEPRFTKLCLHTYYKISVEPQFIIKNFEEDQADVMIKSQEEFLPFFEDMLAKSNNQIRFANCDSSTFPNISEKVYNELMLLLNTFLTNEKVSFTNEEHKAIIGILFLARVGGIKYGKLYEVYAHFLTFLELITETGKPQQARDFLEDLIIASDYDSLYYCGLIAKLDLAVTQQRNFEALFILIFTCLKIKETDKIDEHFFYIFKLSIAQLFRNLNFYKLAEDEFKNIIFTFNLDNYKSQQVHHSYFSCKTAKKDTTVIQEVENYLYQHIESILKYAENSSRPWINLLCSIKNIFNYNSKSLIMFLELFDRTMKPEDQKQFYNLIGYGNDLKQSLIFNINNIYKSRRSDDIGAHLKSIEPIVSKAIEYGLKNDDFDILLIATIARSLPLSMQELTIPDDELIVITVSEKKNECTFMEDFCKKFEETAKKNDILLFNSFNDSVFCIAYIGGNKTIHKNICPVAAINTWVLKNLDKLGFQESRKKNGQVEGIELFWQEESEKIQNSLPQFVLNKITIQNECLIFSDVNTLKFPINLIRDSLGYISERYPVSYILPSFFYREAYVHLNTPCVNLSRPKQPDWTVERGINIIQEAIETHLNKSQNENKINNPKIRIVVAHGFKENNKFKGIYCGDNKLLLPFEFARNYLSEIVILFVCHAGFSSNMLFNNDSFSIAKELIFQGARHVIAPAWPLNILLLEPWIKTFIHQIEEGKSVSESCHSANMELKKRYKIESAWAVMQHYQG